MKRLAYIFTILTLFFTAQPFILHCQQSQSVIGETSVCSGGTCEKRKKENEKPLKDCDKALACNPFAICSGCHYMHNERFRFTNLCITGRPIKQLLFEENLVAGFVTEFWHPPEYHLA